MKKTKRNPLEHVVVVVIVLLVTFLVGANIYYQRQDVKQRNLFYQLQILRSGVNLFKVVEGKNPINLVELAHGVYKFPGDRETRKFLPNAPIDGSGRVSDPFGNEYYYDHTTGWIRSSTAGYEFW